MADKGDSIEWRIRAMCERVAQAKAAGLYFFNMPISELRGGSRVLVNGRQMAMFASYSYLGLIGHPRIQAAARDAIERYGTGTHGVRTLAGTLNLHRELEEAIAQMKGTQDAITFSSGYITNLTVISALVGRHDFVFVDKYDHASIVDGCLLSSAKMVRFKHNDMADLETKFRSAPSASAKLVVTDAVFSMDGDVIDLPRLAELCRQHKAWLMVDEAHSLGVLGKTGHGIEEHFGMEGVVDIKMGTLSKAVPSVGGYVAGSSNLITYLRHHSRGYIFTAALPPPQAAAALEALRVIQDEPWRIQALQQNAQQLIRGLKDRGFDTLNTETAIVPLLCVSDENAFRMTREAHEEDLFVLPVVSPAVPEGTARLRTTVTAAHEASEIEQALDVFERAGKKIGVI